MIRRLAERIWPARGRHRAMVATTAVLVCAGLPHEPIYAPMAAALTITVITLPVLRTAREAYDTRRAARELR